MFFSMEKESMGQIEADEEYTQKNSERKVLFLVRRWKIK